MTHCADLEKLLGLRLDALGPVDDHDRGVRRHQRAVCVFREILMSRCVQNVDAAAVIFKLQNRTGNGNTSLLLDFHPVRNGMFCRGFSLYRTGCIDRAAVEQKLFGQCCFAGIRVGNNGERPPPCDFFLKCHALCLSLSISNSRIRISASLSAPRPSTTSFMRADTSDRSSASL